MKILVVGSGGREHAITWKLAQSSKVKKIFCAPGNGGMKEMAELVNIDASDVEALLWFAKKNMIDLTIVGPEAPLVDGIVDRFEEEGLKIFGPRKELALLEGSKVFSKEIMNRFNLPTAEFKVFSDAKKAKEHVREKGMPIVIKADGLCAGKGVIVASTLEEADDAIDSMIIKKAFGISGERIIIEECLKGEEASILVFSDGKTILPLASSQDHKRIFDGDKGPNTGGMGAYSPAPVVGKELFDSIIEKIFKVLIVRLSEEGMPYKGVLYGGLMITDNGPHLLEFNVRFGDPETQAILPRLKTDLLDIMLACAEERLDELKIEWDERPCVSIVCASKGYPGSCEKGKEIHGLEDVKNMKDVVVFHAGTKYEKDKIITSGGRVLAVTGSGSTIKDAKVTAYDALSKIKFEGMQYRKDIGDKAIQKVSNRGI